MKHQEIIEITIKVKLKFVMALTPLIVRVYVEERKPAIDNQINHVKEDRRITHIDIRGSARVPTSTEKKLDFSYLVPHGLAIVDTHRGESSHLYQGVYGFRLHHIQSSLS